MERLFNGILLNAWHFGMRYLAVAVAFSLLWLWWRQRPGSCKPLQSKPVAGSQIRREMLTTVVALFVLGSVLPILFYVGFWRHTKVYHDIGRYGWGYLVLSIFLMMLIQDTWFYWTHRLMHHRLLFRLFHRTHHRSTNTNPWSTYTIAPLEAVVNSGAMVLILLLIPANGIALLIFSWLNITSAVYSHLGYELYPRGMGQHWLGRWINTSVAHNTHHAHIRYNYGWYFLFWDRAMGTLDPDYAARFRAAHGPS